MNTYKFRECSGTNLWETMRDLLLDSFTTGHSVSPDILRMLLIAGRGDKVLEMVNQSRIQITPGNTSK
jgi:hypothetical protein